MRNTLGMSTAIGHVLGLLGVWVSMLALTPTNASASARDPVALYGPELAFDVYRLGSKIGTHTVSFKRDGGDAIVATSDTKLVVTLLTVPIYSFTYSASARWVGGQMQALRARADTNGAITSVSAQTSGGIVSIRNAGGSTEVPAPLFPTNHWHVGVVGQDRVLNTITGQLNTVAIRKANTEAVATASGKVQATRYQYSGDLANVLWYDAAGRWVGMTFPGSDGIEIKFVCRRCQGGAASRAAKTSGR